MKKTIAAFLSIVIILAVVGVCLAFSDADLEKYQSGGGQIIRNDEPTRTANTGNRDANASPVKTNDAQAWCDKSREISRQLSSARAAYNQAVVGKAEADAAYNSELFSRRVGSSQAKATASSRLSEAEAALSAARGSKTILEDDAHRQGVPAGWLNCNFN